MLLYEKNTSLITKITRHRFHLQFCSGNGKVKISLEFLCQNPPKPVSGLWMKLPVLDATLVLKGLVTFIFTGSFSVTSYCKTNTSSFHYLIKKVGEQIMLSPAGSVMGHCIFNNYTVLQVYFSEH